MRKRLRRISTVRRFRGAHPISAEWREEDGEHMNISRRSCLRILGGGLGFAGVGVLAACAPTAPPAATSAPPAPTSPPAAKPAPTDAPKPAAATTPAPAAKPTTAPAVATPSGQIVVAEPLTLDTFDPIM